MQKKKKKSNGHSGGLNYFTLTLAFFELPNESLVYVPIFPGVLVMYYITYTRLKTRKEILFGSRINECCVRVIIRQVFFSVVRFVDFADMQLLRPRLLVLYFTYTFFFRHILLSTISFTLYTSFKYANVI